MSQIFKNSLSVLIVSMIMASSYLALPTTQKQYTFGIFCLAIDHEMENVIRAKLRDTSPDSPMYTPLLKSLCRLPSTYMKFLNLRGIRFMPIFYNNNNTDAHQEQMDYLDGIFLIGGTVYGSYPRMANKNEDSDYDVLHSNNAVGSEYYDNVEKIVAKAKAINDSGRKFLLFGVCMGFEAILMANTGFKPKLYYIKNNLYQRTINFNIPNVDNNSSRLKTFMGQDNIQLFATNESAYFFHNYAVSLENFTTDPAIYNELMPVATFTIDSSKKPLEFVASYEHRKYPFFATQFHPEKILFETHPSMKRLVKNEITTKLSSLFVDFIYKELENGAAGNPVPLEAIKKFSCPRYAFYDLLIFHEAFVYDCVDFLGRNFKTPLTLKPNNI